MTRLSVTTRTAVFVLVDSDDDDDSAPSSKRPRNDPPPAHSLLSLNDDALRHVTTFMDDGGDLLALALTCTRTRNLFLDHIPPPRRARMFHVKFTRPLFFQLATRTPRRDHVPLPKSRLIHNISSLARLAPPAVPLEGEVAWNHVALFFTEGCATQPATYLRLTDFRGVTVLPARALEQPLSTERPIVSCYLYPPHRGGKTREGQLWGICSHIGDLVQHVWRGSTFRFRLICNFDSSPELRAISNPISVTRHFPTSMVTINTRDPLHNRIEDGDEIDVMISP